MSSHGHGNLHSRTSDVCVPMDTTFSKMHLINSYIREGLKKENYIVPSPIQRKALPRTLCGYDTIVKAKSGTGKTAVFAVTALQSVIDLESNQPQVLILAPTREIAVQIVGVIKAIGAFVKDLKVEYFIGGTDLQDDVEKLKNCRIVVGAPGRIAHLIDLGHLSTKSIRLFVVDEADQMIQTSFFKDFNFIFNNLPESKQVLICSATFTYDIIKFLRKYMTTFCFVSGDQEDDTHGEKLSFASLVGMKPYISIIDKKYSNSSVVLFKMKMNRLEQILKTTTFSQCLIFTNYITSAKTISNRLRETGFVTAFLCSEQTQTDRLQALDDFKQGKVRILVSTDIAARGIDVENVDTVLNFEVPIDEQTYLHRMGRAGRYGSRGVVITIAAGGIELTNLKKILGTIKASVAILPSRPPFVDAADIGKMKLEELMGVTEKEAQHCVSAVTSEMDFVHGYILRKGTVKEVYGCEIEDINLQHFKEDIDHHVEKLKEQARLVQKHPFRFEMDFYFLLSKFYNHFHPQFLDYVENVVSNSLQLKNVPQLHHIIPDSNKLVNQLLSDLSNFNSKENICPSNCELSIGNQLSYGSIKTNFTNIDFSEIKSECNFDWVLSRSFLQRLYSVSWAEEVNINQFKSSIERDFESLKFKSSDFSAELKMCVGPSDILHANSKNIDEKIEYYFCFCKTFKKINQNLVYFVERKLNEQKMKHIKEFGALINSPKVPSKNESSRRTNHPSTENQDNHKLSSSYSSNLTPVGIRLAPNLIKRKPNQTKTPFQKSCDDNQKRLATKYLYLKQDLLKRLYQATKVSKDFCVESFRLSIEPSFSQLWKSNLSTETVRSLEAIDILKRPMKGLNSHTLQIYFQFCRHFHFINPDLVASVSKKVERIEAGLICDDLRNSSLEKNESNEDESLKNTGRIPANVLSSYFGNMSKKLSDLEIDQTMKEKISKKVSVESNFVPNLKKALGQNLFMEQSCRGDFFLSYFKLCQTFRNFDADFLSYVEERVKKMPDTIPNVRSQICNDFNNDANIPTDSAQRSSINSNTSEVSRSNPDVIQPSASVESMNAESDSSFVLTEGVVTQSYKELSSYPPCGSVPIPTTKNFDVKLSSILQNCLPNVLKTAENDGMYLTFKSEEAVPAAFNILKGVEETNDKVLERFSERALPTVIRTIDDSSKLSENHNHSSEVKNQEQNVSNGESAPRISKISYGELLNSFQTSELCDKVISADEQRPILNEAAKTEMQSFCESMKNQTQNHIYFSNRVSAREAIKLLYNDNEYILKSACNREPKFTHDLSHVGMNDGITTSNLSKDTHPTPIGFSNLSPQEISIISGQPCSSNSANSIDCKVKQIYQDHLMPVEVSKTEMPMSKTKVEARNLAQILSKKGSINEEGDSSDWVTASSADSDTDEESPSTSSVLKTKISKNSSGHLDGHQSGTMNLCDRCKNWYKSTGNMEVLDIPVKTRHCSIATKKVKAKKNSMDPLVPSYEQLIQWYNMWYQQVAFSQQFVWYNEYLRSMSSQD